MTTVTHDSINGYAAIVLQNRFLRAVIVPSLGGRVWELEDRLRGRQWVWHRERVPLQAHRPGAVYDDVWAGGWEELFPNDAPSKFEGRELPDHGEWWATAWHSDTQIESDAAVVRLSTELSAVKARCSKEFRLASDEATLSVSYRIHSLESEPFHFLFKQHLPIRLSPGCRLALPGGRVTPVDAAFGNIVSGSDSFAWPHGKRQGQSVDLRAIPDAANASQDFFYVSDLPQPWCGIDDTLRGASLRMNFESRAFPFVWLFVSYGGWRDVHTVVLEPCSNMPKDLAEAVRLRQTARLAPSQAFETKVSVSLTGLLETPV